MRRFVLSVGLILFLFFTASMSLPDEGMWPISEILKLNLRAKGLEIDPREIYDPDGPSLIYAVVNVGASGSFVSPEGLIITNHHVAYGSVQAASTPDKDYIRQGFLARMRSEEIPAKGRTARITESFRDVSADVLSAVSEDMDFVARTKAVEQRMKEIVKKAEAENPGKRAEVAEMFPGKSYVLFLFTYLKDIRLVYVPPRSIGEFGGEADNWMWPRHTGDFAFMRAYVAPDGSPAEYAEENVPYKPKRYLEVAPEGVSEGDFVFILGYPGRTYRHSTADFVAYEEEVRMPWVADWYAWQIAVMEKMGESDRSVALKHLSSIKGLSNTMKNYRGKLRGLKSLHLVEKKRKEEEALQAFIEADPKRKNEYGDLLSEIGSVYKDMRARADYELVMEYLRRSVNLIQFAYTAYEASIERQKNDLEREPAYMDRNFDQTVHRLEIALDNLYEPTDRIILKQILRQAASLPKEHRIAAVDRILGNKDIDKAIDEFVTKACGESKLTEKTVLKKALTISTEDLRTMNDPFLALTEELYPAYKELEETQKARKGALDQLYARLLDIKRQFQDKDFIPDANGTLRLTFGSIRGYEPADAVYYLPITTLEGVIEKTTGEEPFDTPAELVELYQARDYGRFVHPDLESVPVCILYDMDTTGGNSGSPVLNARGELVGVNFDRAWEATINDFAWSDSYSRSIAVDIRYVLWVTQKFGGVEHLIREMGIQ